MHLQGYDVMKDKADTVVLAVYTFNTVQYIKENLRKRLKTMQGFDVQAKDIKLIYKVSLL